MDALGGVSFFAALVWTPVADATKNSDDFIFVTMPVNSASQFFRLSTE
jgi:hypothetical protein